MMTNGERTWRNVSLRGNEADMVVAIAELLTDIMSRQKQLKEEADGEGKPLSVYAALLILGKLEEGFEVTEDG